MSSIAMSRVQREVQEVMRNAETAIKLEVDDRFDQLKGEILGPASTPYEFGKFKLQINIPQSYPFSPPKVKFITQIWHPNISSASGCICLDILKDSWAPALSLRTVLLSLQALLSAPEPDDPQDAVVAAQYKKDVNMFVLTAQHWTNVYANGPHKVPEFDTKIQRFKDMGINEHGARAALSRFNWDMEQATLQFFD